MIDDSELRALFKAESEEHLQTLENGLLRLEADPRDSVGLEELFRSAHSLKGAAGMLGIDSVETLAHHFEDELGAARRGHIVISSATVDRLYRGLDAMRRLAREACGGEDAQVDMLNVLAQLRGEILPASPVLEEEKPFSGVAIHADGQDRSNSDTSVPDLSPAAGSDGPLILPDPPPYETVSVLQEPGRNGSALELLSTERFTSDILPSALEMANGLQTSTIEESPSMVGDAFAATDVSQVAVSPAEFKIETIRVETPKLDALMTLAGEMTVTRARAARTLAMIEDLVALWEEWDRDATVLRSASASSFDNISNSTRNRRGNQLARFHERETLRLERLGDLLGHLHRTSDESITRMGIVAEEMDEAIRDMRLLPFSTIFNLFPRLVRDLSRELEKEVRLEIDGGTVTVDKHLLEEMKDPLMHLLRNAIDHGLERPDERERQGKPRMATIWLRACQVGGNVVIEIADDGRGLDEEAIRRAAVHKRLCSASEIAVMSPEEARMLIFAPGFSTSPLITDVSGRGVGLDVVRTNIERLKGTIAVESEIGRGCTFRLKAPITLATTRVLIVQVARRSYALPLESVQETYLVSSQTIFPIEGRPTIRRNGQPVLVAHLVDLLELPPEPTARSSGKENGEYDLPERHLLPCILLAIGTERLGLFVDALLDEQQVILKPFGGLLQRVRNVFGATILSTGEICMVLNPQDLIKSAQKSRTIISTPELSKEVTNKKLLLLAEDSITTRTQEKRILEGAGYEVVTAVDGADALNKLRTRPFDAVISDIDMPNIDGLTLAAHIRLDTKYKELPIILVTSLASDEDRQRGSEVGANAYITKGAFDQTVLLDTLRRLV